MHFNNQAIALKRLIRAFDPYQVIIDGTGLGVGLLDFMVMDNTDYSTGETFPAIGSFNDAELKKSQPKDCQQLIYVIKANEKLNSECFSNCFTQISSGRVGFLIKEQVAKEKLMATKVGQKLPIDKKVEKLMPYEMTTRLFDEMCNLKPKQGSDGLKLERINSRIPKDKFSAFIYGLWLIKGIEEKYYKKRRNEENSLSKFVFFSNSRK